MKRTRGKKKKGTWPHSVQSREKERAKNDPLKKKKGGYKSGVKTKFVVKRFCVDRNSVRKVNRPTLSSEGPQTGLHVGPY